jgi:DNA-binding NarL/FixJ family response regulator
MVSRLHMVRGAAEPAATAESTAGGCSLVIACRTPVITAGVRTWIETAAPHFRVVGIASKPCELHALWRAHRPQVVVLVSDLHVPSLLTVMRQEASDVRILVLAKQCELRHEVALIRAGASGVLSLCCQLEELVSAIELLRGGRASVSAAAVRALASREGCQDLTSRQREILDLLNDGVRPREIAERLVISPNTVKTHMFRMRKRLQDERALASLGADA